MKLTNVAFAIVASAALTACSGGLGGLGFEGDNGGIDKTKDGSRDAKDLSQLVAGIWVDPNGCDHWIIDDGIEGYLSSRLDPQGKPVCSGHGAETIVYGPFRSGSESVNRRTDSDYVDDASPVIPR